MSLLLGSLLILTIEFLSYVELFGCMLNCWLALQQETARKFAIWRNIFDFEDHFLFFS